LSANAELIARFYEAFARRDAAAMHACYAPDVHFSDPVFPDLSGEAARGMWSMLCAAGKDLKIVSSGIDADGTRGKAHWEAWYTFGRTGRQVHNVIDAEFELKDGLIVRHVDRFDFWRWSRQALGPAGMFLGWTPFFRNAIRRSAGSGLAKYLAEKK
jgi:ketosteroid isomerase-like protein